jgi:peptidoglycan/LPS O-acetylase OafA/YrhL
MLAYRIQRSGRASWPRSQRHSTIDAEAAFDSSGGAGCASTVRMLRHNESMAEGGAPTIRTTSDTEPGLPSESAPPVDPTRQAVATPGGEAVPWRLGNRPPLTGIRVPFMATVLIFHSNFQTLPGSWVSLAIFFVLSGFLITAMLAGEQQRTGGLSLKNFYSRRAIRLLPPLFIIVALLGVYSSIVHVHAAANDLWTNAAGAVFYFADYQAAFHHEPPIAYLSQCWSLAVEEQFYLVWAVLLFVALRYSTRRLAYGIAIVGVLASFADRMYIVLHAPHWDSIVAGRVYYAFDTRADALFVGCLLGLVATGGHLNDWPLWAKRTLSLLAVAGIGSLIWVMFNVGLSARSLPMWWIPISEMATVLIITYFLIHPTSLSARLFGLPILVLLGNMTYSIYVFHWPVYVIISPYGLPVHGPFWELETVRLVVIMALAIASWFLVEKRLMAWRKKAFPSGEAKGTGDRAADPTRAPVQTVPASVISDTGAP